MIRVCFVLLVEVPHFLIMFSGWLLVCFCCWKQVVWRFKMARYDGEDYEDLDEYEDEGEELEEEGSGEEQEEEEEEEEAPRHTQEELEYLELRQRLKESFRKKMKKESGSSLANTEEKKKLPYSNFGSFFGPSQPVIAQRVIQESKSLLENQHLAAKVSTPHRDKNKSSTSTAAGSKAQAHGHRPMENEAKVNPHTVKQTRDYSFLLSDDAELPVPTNNPPTRPVSLLNSEARSAQVPPNGKHSLNKTERHVANGRDERKSMSTGSLMHPKAGSHKLTSASRPILTSVQQRKKLGNSNGSGPGRPLGTKDLTSKKPTATQERRDPTAVTKSSLFSAQKQPSSKLHSSASKQPMLKNHVDQKKEVQEYRKQKVLPKPQLNRPPAKISSRPPLREDRPKKKAVRQYSDQEDEESPGAIRSMIQQMFGYNPKKYAGRDLDDSDMEANFEDILKEEKRSARIAREEDEEELRKIEEEERREKLRLQERKRKLSHR